MKNRQQLHRWSLKTLSQPQTSFKMEISLAIHCLKSTELNRGMHSFPQTGCRSSHGTSQDSSDRWKNLSTSSKFHLKTFFHPSLDPSTSLLRRLHLWNVIKTPKDSTKQETISKYFTLDRRRCQRSCRYSEEKSTVGKFSTASRSDCRRYFQRSSCNRGIPWWNESFSESKNQQRSRFRCHKVSEFIKTIQVETEKGFFFINKNQIKVWELKWIWRKKRKKILKHKRKN